MLGTAQFGMKYGIANRQGQLSYEAVRDILACAIDGGVNCLDTAAMYGDSEEFIGRALRELGAAESMIVVTKLPHLPPDIETRSAVKAWMRESVSRSLKRLRLDALPLCLFHKEADSRYLDLLLDIKKEGAIRRLGVSCDFQPARAIELASGGDVDALQIPANILDSRHLSSGILSEKHGSELALFVRSVYLQGLLLMPEADIPVHLKAVLPARRRFERIAEEAGFGLAELAVRYILSLEGVTCVIAGVESVEQLRHNIELFSKKPLDEELMAAVSSCVPVLPEEILTPYLWKK